jgi:hypothetical protein
MEDKESKECRKRRDNVFEAKPLNAAKKTRGLYLSVKPLAWDFG